jgi:hypothetical protein
MTRRHRCDHGSGLLSTSFGIAVLLALLALCAHVLLNLWVMGVVEDVAVEAAHRVATSGASDEDLPAVQAAEVERARRLLGRWTDAVRFEFEADPTGRTTRLRVHSEQVRLLPALGSTEPLGGGLDRTVVRRRELPGAGR